MCKLNKPQVKTSNPSLESGKLNITPTVRTTNEFMLATNVNSSFEHPTSAVPLAREDAN